MAAAAEEIRVTSITRGKLRVRDRRRQSKEEMLFFRAHLTRRQVRLARTFYRQKLLVHPPVNLGLHGGTGISQWPQCNVETHCIEDLKESRACCHLRIVLLLECQFFGATAVSILGMRSSRELAGERPDIKKEERGRERVGIFTINKLWRTRTD